MTAASQDALHREALALGLRAQPVLLGRHSFRGMFAGIPVSCEAQVDGADVLAVVHAHFPHALRLGLAITSPGQRSNPTFDSFIERGTTAFTCAGLPRWRLRAADVAPAQQLMEALTALTALTQTGDLLVLDDQQLTLRAPYSTGSLQGTLTRVASASEQVLTAWRAVPRPPWEQSTLRRWRELSAREGWHLDEAALSLQAAPGGTMTTATLRRAPMVMTLETEVVARLTPPGVPGVPEPPSLVLSLSAPGAPLPMLAAFGLGDDLEALDLDDDELSARFVISASDAEIGALALNETVRDWLCALPAAVGSGQLAERKLTLWASEALGAADLVATIDGCARLLRTLAT